MENNIPEYQNDVPEKGKLLISDPFLPDPNFNRTVVFLTEHQTEGSVGFVLNKPLKATLDDVIEVPTSQKIPIYLGGPVQQETLHILHMNPSIGEPTNEVTRGVYWGANFEAIKVMIQKNELDPKNYRFFLGYSGWGEKQLENELDQKSWIVTQGNQEIVFSNNTEELWKKVLQQMGGEFSYLANSPDNPQWN